MMHKILSLALLLAAAAALAEPGSVSRATDLKEKPFLDSATVAKLGSLTLSPMPPNSGNLPT